MNTFEYIAVVAGGWTVFLLGLLGVIYAAGVRADRRREARRPPAPLVELDLHRARRSAARGGYIHHNTPGGTAA